MLCTVLKTILIFFLQKQCKPLPATEPIQGNREKVIESEKSFLLLQTMNR